MLAVRARACSAALLRGHAGQGALHKGYAWPTIGPVLKPLANTAFLPAWTVVMVSYAVTRSTLQRDRGVFRRAQRDWARGITDFSGIDVSVTGAEHLDPAGRYVLVSNHQSHLDIPILFMSLPVTPGFVAKKELSKVPFLAQALDYGGHVLIDRTDRDSARASMEQAAAEVRGGKTVLVFPEGTRGGQECISRFKSGAFHLAKAAGVPLVPIGVRGTRRVFPREGMLIHGGKVEVHVGQPFDPAMIAGSEVHELAEQARACIAELSAMPLCP